MRQRLQGRHDQDARPARSSRARSRPAAAATAGASCRPSSCPRTATTTMAPSVASGSGSNSGVRNSATRAVAAAAVTSEAGVWAPARSLAADFESDEPIGNPVKRPAPVFAAPIAISSRFGSILPPCSRANSLAGPMASAKATSAIPTAPTEELRQGVEPDARQRGAAEARRQVADDRDARAPRGRGRPRRAIDPRSTTAPPAPAAAAAPARSSRRCRRRRRPGSAGPSRAGAGSCPGPARPRSRRGPRCRGAWGSA